MMPTGLAESLAVEVAGNQDLLELLCAVQEALRVADAHALARIAPAKLVQVHALQEQGAARSRTLREEGFAEAVSGMRAMLGHCAQPDLACDQWVTLIRSP
jgi:hypothetical protein